MTLHACQVVMRKGKHFLVVDRFCVQARLTETAGFHIHTASPLSQAYSDNNGPFGGSGGHRCTRTQC